MLSHGWENLLWIQHSQEAPLHFFILFPVQLPLCTHTPPDFWHACVSIHVLFSLTISSSWPLNIFFPYLFVGRMFGVNLDKSSWPCFLLPCLIALINFARCALRVLTFWWPCLWGPFEIPVEGNAVIFVSGLILSLTLMQQTEPALMQLALRRMFLQTWFFSTHSPPALIHSWRSSYLMTLTFSSPSLEART